jgi:hypothetical protein
VNERRKKPRRDRGTPRNRRRRAEPQRRPSGPDRRLKLDPLHLLLVGGGVLVAVLGFWVLSTGSITTAPILLVLAYLVLIPVGLALPSQEKKGDRTSSDA